jgi:hypothetical protein
MFPVAVRGPIKLRHLINESTFQRTATLHKRPFGDRVYVSYLDTLG